MMAAMLFSCMLASARAQMLPPLEKPGTPPAANQSLPSLNPPKISPPAGLTDMQSVASPLPDRSLPILVREPEPAQLAPIQGPQALIGPGTASTGPPVTPRIATAAATASANVPASASPVVTVELIGPETANIGNPVPYELVVRNLGKSAVYQVRLEQELPPGVRYLGAEPPADLPGDRLTWNLGILDAGAEKRVKVHLQSATEGEVRSKATVTYSATCATTTRFTRAKVVLSMTGPDTAMVGDTVAFQIRVSNAGTGPIKKLLLRNRLPAGLSHPAGNILEAELIGLAAGETRTITLKTTASKVGQYASEMQAIADVVAAVGLQPAGSVRNPDLEATARVELRIVEPGLQMRLTGPKACLVKCDAVFSVDLTNPGTAPTRNIRLVTRIPDGMDFLAVSDDGLYEPATRTVSWSIPVLEPAAHRVVTVKARGMSLGDVSAATIAQADGNLSARAEMPIKVEGVSALSLEVMDPDDPAPVGSEVTYEIRVANQGTCPCTGIQIVAMMPEGMELREASAPTPYKVNGQQVQFAAHDKLATKADLLYRLKVKTKLPGDVRFRVQLTCDQLQQPVFKEESSRFYKP